MAFGIANPTECLGHEADHPITRGVAMRIVDPFEIVDVAKRHAQRFAAQSGFAHFAVIHFVECAPVGQTGQVVLVGLQPRFVEPGLQRGYMRLAAGQFAFHRAGVVQHMAGQRGQSCDHIGACRCPLQIGNMAFKRHRIGTGGDAHPGHGPAQIRQAVFQFSDQHGHRLCSCIAGLRCTGFFQPFQRDRQAFFGAFEDPLRQLRTGARDAVVGDCQCEGQHVQVVVDQEIGNLCQHPAFGRQPDLALGQFAAQVVVRSGGVVARGCGAARGQAQPFAPA